MKQKVIDVMTAEEKERIETFLVFGRGICMNVEDHKKAVVEARKRRDKEILKKFAPPKGQCLPYTIKYEELKKFLKGD